MKLRVLYESISGEFWIEDGVVTFADSDIGDIGHEGLAIQHAQYLLADDEDYEGWKRSVVLKVLDEKKQELEDAKAELEQKGASTKRIDDLLYEIWEMGRDIDYHAYKIIDENAEALGIDGDLFEIAEGHGDARAFAVERWGWKRIQGSNVETQTLTLSDLKDIAGGLYDAYDEDVEGETFSIYVMSSGKWYNDVPYEVIDGGDLFEVMRYGDARGRLIP